METERKKVAHSAVLSNPSHAHSTLTVQLSPFPSALYQVHFSPSGLHPQVEPFLSIPPEIETKSPPNRERAYSVSRGRRRAKSEKRTSKSSTSVTISCTRSFHPHSLRDELYLFPLLVFWRSFVTEVFDFRIVPPILSRFCHRHGGKSAFRIAEVS